MSPTDMYEIWWPEEGRRVLRAKFSKRADALRYAWRHGRADDAELVNLDGRSEPVCAFEIPAGLLALHSPVLGSHPPRGEEEGQAPRRVEHMGGRGATGEHLGHVRIDPADVALEVMRRTGRRDSQEVLAIVRETLGVLERMARRDPTVQRMRPGGSKA